MRSQVWLGTCHQGIGAGNLMMSQVQVELYQGTQWSVSLSSGWVINYHQVFMVIPYFLFIHHLRGILGALLREQQYLISERLNEKESN